MDMREVLGEPKWFLAADLQTVTLSSDQQCVTFVVHFMGEWVGGVVEGGNKRFLFSLVSPSVRLLASFLWLSSFNIPFFYIPIINSFIFYFSLIHLFLISALPPIFFLFLFHVSHFFLSLRLSFVSFLILTSFRLFFSLFHTSPYQSYLSLSSFFPLLVSSHRSRWVLICVAILSLPSFHLFLSSSSHQLLSSFHLIIASH